MGKSIEQRAEERARRKEEKARKKAGSNKQSAVLYHTINNQIRSRDFMDLRQILTFCTNTDCDFCQFLPLAPKAFFVYHMAKKQGSQNFFKHPTKWGWVSSVEDQDGDIPTQEGLTYETCASRR